MKRQQTRSRHNVADALDWEEAMKLIDTLMFDARYRDAMLIASGCYLGLRISDLLTLKWIDLIDSKQLTMVEQKTGKTRILVVNKELSQLANRCYEALEIDRPEMYIFSGQVYGEYTHISRQRADQILKECKKRYKLATAKIFSTHSLRKTFGRRVWLNECKKGHGEQALMLLCDVFGHSSVKITKRYLGIRRDEILSVYDAL